MHSTIKSILVDHATIRDKGLGEVTVMDIDPAFAAQLLSTLSDKQRPVRPKVVKRYASDMRAGRYPANGEPYQLDRNLKLINGQHRCMAIVETGITAKSQMIVILSGAAVPKGDAAIMTIDQGVPRHLRDMQVMTGSVPLSRSLSGAIIAEHFSWNGYRDVTNQEKILILNDFDLLDETRKLEAVGPKRGSLFTVGSGSAAIRCLRKSREAAMQFFSAVFAFDHIVYGEPNKWARMLYMNLHKQVGTSRAGGNSNTDVVLTAYKTIRAWNAWRDEEPISKLQAPVTPGKMLEAKE